MKNVTKKMAMLITALFCMGSVCAFGTKESVSAQEKPVFSFEDKANEVVITDSTVTVSDFFGTEKTLTRGAYKNVVSLYHSHTALWYEAGGNLVGRVHTDGAEAQLPAEALQDDVAIVANGITSNTISIEEILKVNPDLVILGQAMGQPSLVPALASVGIETIVVDYSDLSDYLKWFKVFAYLNNQGENYDAVAKQTVNNVIDIINSVPQKEVYPTVLPIFSAAGTITVSLSGTALGNMISQLQAVNVANRVDESTVDGRIEMNLESIMLADPDIILIQTMDADVSQSAVNTYYKDNKLWNSLRAVQEGRVYFLDPGLFHYRPHSQYDKAYQALYDIFYEDI
ncbi:MAG: ABC transporter substrate-binding protein [Spirochaetales bacterium]